LNEVLEEKYRKTVSRYHTFKLKASDQLRELIIFKQEIKSCAIKNTAIESKQASLTNGTF
jgi:hypothetical protein